MVAEANGRLGPGFGFADCGQQQPGEDREDSNHDQQFHQSEALIGSRFVAVANHGNNLLIRVSPTF